jgi:hypothetical protein
MSVSFDRQPKTKVLLRTGKESIEKVFHPALASWL